MFKSALKYFWILSFLTSLFFFTGCSSSSDKNADVLKPTPTILTSIPPYAYFIQKIAGETVTVQTLVPAGANPHLFEPTPKQVEEAHQALLWLQIGEAFEKKVTTVLKERNPKLVLVDLCEGIPLLPLAEHDTSCGCEGHHDRHIWLSPKLAKKQAALIEEKLSLLFPEQKELYRHNLSSFVNELDQLDQEIAALLHSLKGEALLVSHPAFAYFCKDYDLLQLSVEHDGKDPLPQHIHSLLASKALATVKSVLTQPQYNNKGAELIAEKLHLPIFLVDPYSSDYHANLKGIANHIASP